MADRYIIHGATYCGDGAASNEAASAGAPGAWNNINILTGTAPTNTTNIPTAGDTIYIRSKSSAGADINISITGPLNYGSSAATVNSWITWILDNGEIWPGIDGIVQYTAAAGSIPAGVQPYNHIKCMTQDALRWVSTLDTNGTGCPLANNAIMENVLYDAGGASQDGFKIISSGGPHTYINLHFRPGEESSFGTTGDNACSTFINPMIEYVSLSSKMLSGWSALGRGALLEVYGGKMYGDYATSPANVIVGSQGCNVKMLGLEVPLTMVLPTSSPIGCDFSFVSPEASQGMAYISSAGSVSSRNDGNFPTLNATYPDSVSTPWSYRAYAPTATQARSLHVKISKLYQQAASIKTIKLSLLIADDYLPLINKTNTWLAMTYVDDATGDMRSVHSRAAGIGGSLESDTASWSASFYGAINCGSGKKKIELTTPTAIKQNTYVNLVLFIGAPAATPNDVMFICPDPQLI